MEHPPHDHGAPAQALDTDTHDVSPPNEPSNDIGLSPLVASLSVKHRPGYQRIASVSDDQYASTTFAKTNPDYSPTSPMVRNEAGEGLGLQNVTTQRPHSISRKPVNYHNPRSPSSDTTTPTLNDVLLSPPSRLPSSTLPELREHKIDDDSYDEDGLSPNPRLKRGHTESTASLGKHAGSISGWSPSVSGKPYNPFYIFRAAFNTAKALILISDVLQERSTMAAETGYRLRFSSSRSTLPFSLGSGLCYRLSSPGMDIE